MRLPRFRLRTLMIAAATAVAAAVVIIGLAFVAYGVWALESFYGPGGKLDQEYAAAKAQGLIPPDPPEPK